MRVCHMTSAHGVEDIRIFRKECVSLAKAGYEVYLVERGETYDKDGVHIIGVGEIPEGRLKRMTQGARKVYQAARALDCDVYHLHDPELLPYGLKLKKQGKMVIFDSHEDYPANIHGKYWIPGPLRFAAASAYRTYETYVVSRLDAVVVVTQTILQNFRGRAKRTVIVANYAKLDGFTFHTKPFADRERIVCYAGGITEQNGEKMMTAAMKNVQGRLVLAGWRDREDSSAVKGENEENISFLGRIPMEQVDELYGSARCGLILYQPSPWAMDCSPNKFFEYMASGLPFVASNYPLWKKKTEGYHCCIFVDPENVEEISRAISYLLDHPEIAQEMGREGRRAMEEKYNWEKEAEKLCALYEDLSRERERK